MSLDDISQIRGPGIHTESHIVSEDITLTGIATASNFKTGTSNVHNVGIEIAGINVLGADTPIGHGATICLLYTSPSPRDYGTSRMPSSA